MMTSMPRNPPPPYWRVFLDAFPSTQGLCLAVTLLLATLGMPWGVAAIYSFLIGNLCALFITAGLRLRLLWWTRRAHPDASWTGGLSVVLIVGLAVLPAVWLGSWLGDWVTGQPARWTHRLDMHGWWMGLLISALPSAAGTWLFHTRSRLADAQRQAAEAQAQAAEAARQATEARLRLLESQLEPHMLFNTLANLRALIRLDPAQAQTMLDRLIDYLRATLGASRRASHPLSAEFARLGDYLALMTIRMGPRLQVHLELPAELAETPVPPLLLQPLVENAIQHGLEPHREGGSLWLSARREGPHLVLQVADSGQGLQAAAQRSGDATPHQGFGLTQVRERLATLHGARAELRLQDRPEGGTQATIRLPLAET